MRHSIVVCVGEGGNKEAAGAFSVKNNVPIADRPGEELSLMFDAKGVSLIGFGLSYQGNFENMLHRITNGRLLHEMLVKAAKTGEEGLRAIDATAGMGEDSLLLAAYGYNVTLYEQNPVIAALLRDAICRARKNPQLCEIVGRMKLVEGNSIEFLKMEDSSANVIYLDPMFPKRQKTGLVNKKLQLIQRLEPPCASEEELFEAAWEARPSKIIVKRPLKSLYLAGKKPSYALEGKAIRYDCYVLWK